MAEPMLILSSIEKADPRREMPNTDIDDPNLKNPLNDKLDPNCVTSSTLIELPKLAKP
jgi:hypothetical protein